MHSLAIFGGTFDPIHNGHLQTSLNVQHYFKFNAFSFLPCKTPAIKPPSTATGAERVAMIELAIEDYPFFSVDLREINRATPSYMVDTLRDLRQEYPDSAITLIIGYDALVSLPRWHQWQKLITLANLLVINRTAFSHLDLPESIAELLKTHQTTDKEELLTTKAGVIMLFDAGNYPISSTQTRKEIQEHHYSEANLPPKVAEYIAEKNLYRQK